MPDLIGFLDNIPSSAELTARAQAVDPLNREDINLFLRFFPFQDVNSTRLADVTTLDFRPVADRREWNAQGRLIPLKTPPFRELEMNPIEAYFTYDERLINRLAEGANGNEQVVRDIIGADVPMRVDAITDAVWRRVLVDCMKCWATGTIVILNPQDGASYTVSYGIDAARYVTAPTAWNDATVNAYDLFMAEIDAAQALMGPIKGAVMRRATQTAILADAPDQPNGARMTRGRLADQIAEDSGVNFEFAVVEQKVDIFNDGGTATTSTNIWPAQKVAFIPEGDMVGRAARAPVRRAGSLVPGLTPDQYDVRSVAIFPESRNNGKQLNIEAQANILPVPNEQLLYVVDAGV